MVSDTQMLVLLFMIYLYLYFLEKERQGRPAARKHWIHPFTNQRLTKGLFHVLYSKLRCCPKKFQKHFRMSTTSFDELLTILKPGLSRTQTLMRDPISPEERLCLTLRLLATGQSFSSLYIQFHIGRTTIGKIVRETCLLLWSELQRIVMPSPDENKWMQIAEYFHEKVNFPNCAGALGGRHIRVRMPANRGSKYYKKNSSVVLLAAADVNYCFSVIDVGSYHSTGNASAFQNSELGRQLSERTLHLPLPKPLPGTVVPNMPYVFLGDEAFGLAENVIQPYPGSQKSVQKRVFNYRFSRAQRILECAFGILSNKWHVLHTAKLKPDFVSTVIKACCVLHNFVRLRDGYIFKDTLTDELPDVNWAPARVPAGATGVREYFSNYFMSPDGAIPWQLNRI